MKQKNRRKQLLLYPTFQKAILRRVFVYWLFCALFITVPVVIINALSHPQLSMTAHFELIWSQYWLLFTLSLLLLPLTLMDALRLSHGFVGPVYRLRKELERFVAHPEVSFSKYRDTDFWSSLSVDVERIEQEMFNCKPGGKC